MGVGEAGRGQQGEVGNGQGERAAGGAGGADGAAARLPHVPLAPLAGSKHAASCAAQRAPLLRAARRQLVQHASGCRTYYKVALAHKKALQRAPRGPGE